MNNVFYNEKASAEFFYLLWNNTPSNQSLYILVAILLIAFQTGFIFSQEISQIYIASGPEYNKIRSSIMSVDSFFNKLSGFFDVVVISRRFQSQGLILAMFIILGITMAINLSFRRFDLVKGLIRLKATVKQTNPVILSFSALMMNYDIVFFVLSTIGVSAIPCREIMVLKDNDAKASYLNDNSFESSYYMIERAREGIEKIPVWVSNLNDDIVCYSNSHITIAILGFLLLASNFMLKQLSNQLMSFVPSFKVFASKFGNSDLVYDLILMVVLITKTIGLIRFKANYSAIRLIFLFYFVILIVGYLVIFTYRPFYNYYQHRLKCFQVLYLLTLTGFSILVRETNFALIDTEISTLVFMMVALSLLVKMNDNLSRIDIHQLISRIKKNSKNVGERDMLTVYFLIITFIKAKLENETKGFLSGRSMHDDVAFLVKYLLEEHQGKCKKTHCFCKNSKVVQRRSSLYYYKEKLEGTMIFEAMHLLDEMLIKELKTNKVSSDGLFCCYINYLLNFMGRPAKAYKLLQSKIEELEITQKEGNISGGQGIKISALKYMLEHLALKNVCRGSLSLIAFHKELGDISERVNEMSIVTHIRFLNDVERLKSDIKTASDHRTKFLVNLRDNAIMRKSHKISVDYYNSRVRAYQLYWSLSERCGKKYAPLQLIFGYFVLSCCQDWRLASRILTNYTKIMVYARNLHKVFWKPEFVDKEFSVMYISMEGACFHQIKYASSNLFRWIGKSKFSKTKKIENFSFFLLFHFFVII